MVLEYWRKLDAWIADPNQNEIPTVPRRAKKPSKEQLEDIPWHHPRHYNSGKKIVRKRFLQVAEI